MIRCHNFVFVLRESETLALVIRYVYVQYAMKRYGYVLSNTDVDIFDAIRMEVGRSWTLKIFELFCAYVGIRSGDTPWCDRAFKQAENTITPPKRRSIYRQPSYSTFTANETNIHHHFDRLIYMSSPHKNNPITTTTYSPPILSLFAGSFGEWLLRWLPW